MIIILIRRSPENVDGTVHLAEQVTGIERTVERTDGRTDITSR
jgi:hypothetical protein